MSVRATFSIQPRDVIRRISDNTEYIVPVVPAGRVGLAHSDTFVFVRNATAADANLPRLPEADFVQTTAPSQTSPPQPQQPVGPGGRRPGQTEQGTTSGAGVSVFEDKLNKATTAVDLFENLNSSLVLDSKEFGNLLARPAVEPGMLDIDTVKEVSKKLREYQTTLMNDTSNEATAAFLQGFLQCLVTYYTSPDMEVKENFGVHLGFGNNVFLPYAAIKQVVVNAVGSKSSENPLRQYGRLFTATIINLINNGKLQPNYKVLIQHGVPKRFQAYTLDCLRPSYLLYNPNQIRAWQLAQQAAFTRKTGSNQSTLHNTSELKSV